MSTSVPPRTKPPTLVTETPAGLQAVADVITSQRRSMSAVNRQVANATWSDKSLTPVERERYTDFCRSINLNPALGHAQILGGNFYVTHKGLLHLLNADGRMWRVEGSPVLEDSQDFAFWAEGKKDARVWRTTIKLWDAARPEQCIEYTDYGVALLSQYQDKKVTAPQMAKKRAEHRAIRAVLCIDIPSADELYEEQFVSGVATVVQAENPLGEIPLNPPEREPKGKRQEKPQQPPEQQPEKPLNEQILALAAENEIKLEAVLAEASRIAGKQVGSTRDLEALPAEVLCVLLDELEGRGAK